MVRKFDNRRSNTGMAGVSEFILALGIIFVGLVPPVIDLVGLAVSYGVTQLIARRTAARVANATTYNDALNEMQTEALSLNNIGLARFCKLQPIGGYSGCGVDLYIKETNIYTNKTTNYGPNVTLNAADPSTNIYECTIQANYQVSPLISMNLVPFYSSIEGIGQPISFGASWNVALEHPQLLDQSTMAYSVTKSLSKDAQTKSNMTMPITSPGPLTSWNFVSRGTFAPMPGQTQVGGSQPSPYFYSLTNTFFDTGLSLTAGQRISLHMVSNPGPTVVSGAIGGIPFDVPTNTLDFTVPSPGGDLTFSPQPWDGWPPGVHYTLEVIVTN